MTEGFLGRWSKRKQESLTINTPTDAKAVQDVTKDQCCVQSLQILT
ncbi:MAG: hypothetical protein IPF65_09465 [Polaromonas sp.]|nr:hypothetical protein [Polaromonas sp.]